MLSLLTSSLLTVILSHWIRGELEGAAADEKHLREIVTPIFDNELANLRDYGSQSNAAGFLENKYSDDMWFNADFETPCPQPGEDNQSCWHLIEADIEEQSSRRAGLPAEVLTLTFGWRGGCDEDDNPATHGDCLTSERTTRRYARRSLLQYHLIYETDQAPRPIGDSNVPFTSLDVLGPIHTNANNIRVCGQPTTSGVIEVTRSSGATGNAKGRTPTATEKVFQRSSGCPAGSGTLNENGLTRWISYRPLRPLGSENAGCVKYDNSAMPEDALAWMEEGILIARGTNNILDPGQRLDLSSLSDGDVIWSPGDINIFGTASSGVSATIISSQDIRVVGNISTSGSSGFAPAVIGLAAGCSVVISLDTLAHETPLCVGTHDVTMSNIAIVAPSGGIYTEQYQTGHGDGCSAPTVTFLGAATVESRGVFGTHVSGSSTPLIGGWKKNFRFPTNFHLARPPWWPEASPKEWEPLSG